MASGRHQKKPVRATKPARRAPAAPARDSLWRRHERDVWIVVLLVVGLFVVLAEAHALGPVGRGLSRTLSELLGVGRFALAAVVLGLGLGLLLGRLEVDRRRIGWGLGLALVGLCGVGYVVGGRPGLHAGSDQLAHGGGWVGALVGGGLNRALGTAGALIVLGALLLVATIVLTGIGLRGLASLGARLARLVGRKVKDRWREHASEEVDESPLEEPVSRTRRSRVTPTPEPAWDEFEDESASVDDEARDYYGDDGDVGAGDVEQGPAPSAHDDEVTPAPSEPPVSRPRVLGHAISHWDLPPLGLLGTSREQRADPRVLEAAGADLVEALAAHGVETSLVGYTMGPTVTRFELELGPGVKVARVTSLNRDIAYAMATPDVRIVAPIPGRSAIGVEVPNRQRALVALGDLLHTPEA